MANNTTPATVKIGVFIPTECQLLDLASVDVLYIMSREYLAALPAPAHVLAQAPNVQIFYVTSEANFAAGRFELTAALKSAPTHHVGHAEVAPGQLDVIVVPGGPPGRDIGDAARAWLKGHWDNGRADVLSVCTGVEICAQSGILEGKKVCGTKSLQDMWKAKWTDVTFVGEKYRWWQAEGGRLWSCGGITNGNDLMAAYARAGKFFTREVAETGIALAEVGDRPQEY
ncbi:hypothetical protein ACHAQA_004099 [Verticillium albo-atrum]